MVSRIQTEQTTCRCNELLHITVELDLTRLVRFRLNVYTCFHCDQSFHLILVQCFHTVGTGTNRINSSQFLSSDWHRTHQQHCTTSCSTNTSYFSHLVNTLCHSLSSFGFTFVRSFTDCFGFINCHLSGSCCCSTYEHSGFFVLRGFWCSLRFLTWQFIFLFFFSAIHFVLLSQLFNAFLSFLYGVIQRIFITEWVITSSEWRTFTIRQGDLFNQSTLKFIIEFIFDVTQGEIHFANSVQRFQPSNEYWFHTQVNPTSEAMNLSFILGTEAHDIHDLLTVITANV
ncbi:hypothetical protein D3C72_1210770 [compost metagenome]